MAIFDYSASAAGTSTLWNSFGYLGSILNAETDFTQRSSTAFTANYGYGLSFEAKGTGLKYNSDLHHSIKAGTITSFNVISSGDPLIKLSGLNVTVAALQDAFGMGSDMTDVRNFYKSMLSKSDTFKGSTANDFFEGFDGNDLILGNKGQDDLLGGKGNDTINGGLNNDTMNGGTGADHFRFNSKLGGNVDYIEGFSSSSDTIELDNAIFKGIGNAGDTLSGAKFKVYNSGDKLDATDRIFYIQCSGDLWYDADGSGTDHGAVKFAHLESSPTITAADFLII
jgi:Ca2+-binding RTX toxin-like protein